MRPQDASLVERPSDNAVRRITAALRERPPRVRELLRLNRDEPAQRALGIGLSTSGLTLATISAWLGGELVFKYGVGVEQQTVPNASPFVDGGMPPVVKEQDASRVRDGRLHADVRRTRYPVADSLFRTFPRSSSRA